MPSYAKVSFIILFTNVLMPDQCFHHLFSLHLKTVRSYYTGYTAIYFPIVLSLIVISLVNNTLRLSLPKRLKGRKCSHSYTYFKKLVIYGMEKFHLVVGLVVLVV